MPKTNDGGEFAPLPSTLQRSPRAAQDTYETTLERAEAEYDGDQARAHRVAWGAVKDRFEKIGDHWERKAQSGPSDPRSAQPHDAKVAGVGETFGGADARGNAKTELTERAQGLGIEHTSHMTKGDLARAIAKKQR